MPEPLPPYAERLDYLHRALVDDFRTIVGRLPLAGGEKVVDAGCGDGFFTGLLAERLPAGLAVALDNDAAYLAAAQGRLAPLISDARVQLAEGDVNALPFAPASLDAVWSGHSMQSYPDIPHVLAELNRILRPGGLLAILETDNIHSIMLSWPPHVELAVRQAEHREIGSEDSYIGTYFPRFARRLLHAAGFEQVQLDYIFIRRQAPVDDTLTRYVELYLQNLIEQVGARLPRETTDRLEQLSQPDSTQFLPRQEGFFFGSLQVLITARAASTS
jgi:ubiquinone/menaquinone biosynthesis C-methylase UbiE